MKPRRIKSKRVTLREIEGGLRLKGPSGIPILQKKDAAEVAVLLIAWSVEP